jgi:transcription elongation factor GreA
MDVITVEEKAKLEAKLKDLVQKRPEISKRIEEARALGDLKENAEYHAAREDQGHNEAEIKRLEERLAQASVVSSDVVPDDMVFLGATVRLKDLKYGDEELFRLVGESTGGAADHAGEDVTEVTATSPMGEALMKARVGETIRVDAPRGELRFEIVEIL